MTKTNTEQSAIHSPSHYAYAVRERKDSKPFWARIGSAWQHADNKGFNIQLDALPVDGRITLRVMTEAAQ